MNTTAKRDQIEESFTNGQIKQAVEQFKKLRKEYRKEVLKELIALSNMRGDNPTLKANTLRLVNLLIDNL